MNSQIAAFATLAVAAVAASVMGLSLERRARTRARLFGDEDERETSRELGVLGRRLMLAGLGGAGASTRFVVASVSCLAGGVALALLLVGSPVLAGLAFETSSIPVVGTVLARIVLALPWIGAVFMCALPALVVRARRERRVTAVEEDLPMVLELLATLGEGGLGFDASLGRLTASQPTGRPLVDELRLYQLEVRGGGSRTDCLGRLDRRLEVPAVSTAVAALVQAEEMGAGLAEVLRPLAEDVRLRRRERALAKAEALPEKLVFPLVLGFLPGLLVWTLGPSFHQLMTTVDSILRGQQ